MIYCFDQCKLQNTKSLHFSNLIENGAKLLCVSFEEDNRGDLHLQHNNIIKDYDIDYDFILEYDIKRFSLESAFNNIKPYINQIVDFAYKTFTSNDIVIYPNSGSYIARTLHEISFKVGYKFFYYENYYLSQRYQISQIPFTKSKYGYPEQFKLYQNAKLLGDEQEFLNNLIISNDTKYNDKQQPDLPPKGDILVVGQLPWDSNIILLSKLFKNTIELCNYIGSTRFQEKILYKPHPMDNTFNKSDIKHSSIIVTNAHIISLINNVKEVHTISSTVGLEAELRDVKTIWYSDCFQQEFNLYNNLENKLKFIRMSLDYSFEKNQFYNRVMSL
jgi:hypothetical protein